MSNIEFSNESGNPTTIKVVGIGGGGCNAVDRMIASGMSNVSFVAVNTDLQALAYNSAEEKIQIGIERTKGMGAGLDPEKGAVAAEEDLETIKRSLSNCDMVFITAGMGGGTGTGAAPVIAKAATELGCLTIAVVTKPFSFEGNKKMSLAEHGIDKLVEHVDALVTIPNENLMSIVDKRLPFADCLKIADSVLMEGVRGIADLVTNHGLMNVDFADVTRVMAKKGNAVMGMASVKGDQDSQELVEKIISNPLIEGGSIEGATGMLINVTHGVGASLHQLKEVVDVISSRADVNADIITGFVEDSSLEDELKVTVIATGYHASRPVTRGEIFEKSSVDNDEGDDIEQNQYIDIKDKEDQFIPVDGTYDDVAAADSVMDEPYSGMEMLQKSSSVETDFDIPAFLRKS